MYGKTPEDTPNEVQLYLLSFNTNKFNVVELMYRYATFYFALNEVTPATLLPGQQLQNPTGPIGPQKTQSFDKP